MKKIKFIGLIALASCMIIPTSCDFVQKFLNKEEEEHVVVKYTVTFMNGEQVYGTSEVESGKTVELPISNPTKDSTAMFDYTFDKWLLNGVEYDFSSPVSGDITLEASYTSTTRKYTVTFMNGTTKYSSSKVDAGNSVTAPVSDPTNEKDGYDVTFVGWSTDGTQENVVSEFPTSVVSDLTYYAVFTESVITYTATVTFDWEDAPENQTFDYTIEDRDTVLTSIEALIPEENEVYSYAFEDELSELALEDNTITIVRNQRGFSYDFSSQETDELVFLDRGGLLEDDKYGVKDGAFYVNFGNDVLHTAKSFKYFEMEFDAKFESTSASRFNILLGVQDNELNKMYDSCFNSIGRNAIMLVNSTTNGVRYYKDGVQANSTFVNLAQAPGFDTNFVNFKIVVNQHGLTVKVNDVVAIDSAAITATFGKIYFCRADYQGTLKFDNFAIKATDGYVPHKSLTFSTDFDDATLPTDLEFINRNAETYTLSNSQFVSQLNNSNLHTTGKFTEFELSMRVKCNTGRLVIEFGETTINKGYVGGYSELDKILGVMYCCDGGSNPAQMRFFDNEDTSTNFNQPLYNTKKEKSDESNLINNFVDITLKFEDGKVSGTIDGETIMDKVSVSTVPNAGSIIIAGGAASTKVTIESLSITDLF